MGRVKAIFGATKEQMDEDGVMLLAIIGDRTEEVIREAERICSYSLEVKDLLDEYKGL